MNFASVCSGIEAPSVAWHPLGWKAQWFSEIDPAANAVLDYHYPEIPNLGDMEKLHDNPTFRRKSIDLLVGGTPCQSFSVAGLRKGMADPRGNLALVFLKLVDHARPKWVVWENVPGVLSADGGEAFGSFIGGMAQLGYGLAWRILDAQWLGVPQRRRRIFVVGYLGDWRRAAAVLFERHSLSGNPPPGREKRTGPASGVSHSLKASGGFKQDDTHETYVTGCLRGGSKAQGGSATAEDLALVAHTLKGEGFDASEDGTGRSTLLVFGVEGKDIGFSLRSNPSHSGDKGDGGINTTLIANSLRSHPRPGSNSSGNIYFQQNSRSEVRDMGDRAGAVTSEPGAQCQNYLKDGMTVRRLTPRECERLQGFPDDYTLVPYRGRMMADGPRYKMLGNSMAVPVMNWISWRIQMVEEIPAK